MLIRLGYEITLSCEKPTAFVALLDVHPERGDDILSEERRDAGVEVSRFRDMFGNTCSRFTAPAGQMTLHYDALVRDSGLPDPVTPAATEAAPPALPDHVLTYLIASRYCETDLLMPVAWRLFGHLPPGWQRVQAIFDYAHARLRFGYEHARATRTAVEAHEEQVGVCRDFAHLAITLCRCMNIPARYVNGYMGDIGLPADPAPMDFNAWCEVWLGGRWHTFDARHNMPRIGRIVVARGRDATDIPLLHSFGPHSLAKFTVWTSEVTDDAEHNVMSLSQMPAMVQGEQMLR